MDTTKFSEAVLDLLDETFESHRGIYTYEGTSLLETLSTISAEEASVPIGGTCPTLAAQVAHVIYYLEVMERSMRGEELGTLDWEEIWQTVSAVTSAEWEASQRRLADTYHRIRETVRGFETWEEERLGVLAIITHTAYHLGVIRQSLCVLR